MLLMLVKNVSVEVNRCSYLTNTMIYTIFSIDITTMGGGNIPLVNTSSTIVVYNILKIV